MRVCVFRDVDMPECVYVCVCACMCILECVCMSWVRVFLVSLFWY